ncbi:hypothetical protein D3C72_1611830 [compost metagenome]
MALQRPLHGDFAVIGRQIATYMNRLGALLCALARGQPPHPVGIAALPDADAVMPRQIPRRGRHAVLAQVFGRGAQQAPVRGQELGDDPRVRRLPEPHADIEGILRQRRRIRR